MIISITAFIVLLGFGLVRKQMGLLRAGALLGTAFLSIVTIGLLQLFLPLSDSFVTAGQSIAIFTADLALILRIFRDKDAKDLPQAGRPARPISQTRHALLALFALLTAGYFAGYIPAVHHRFPVDDLEQTPGKGTEFIAGNFEEWDHAGIASQTWWYGGFQVRHAIYSCGGVFVFTGSGLVFVLNSVRMATGPGWTTCFGGQVIQSNFHFQNDGMVIPHKHGGRPPDEYFEFMRASDVL